MLGTATTFAQSASAPKPPVAEKIRTERPINGAVLVDDYAWLRERSNPQVRQYLELENAYAEQVTASEKPFAEKLYSETLSHIKQSDTSVPYRKRGYWYYLRTEEGKQYPVLCRKKETLSSPEEVMLDYDNVTATAYPAILVQTSFDDSQVMIGSRRSMWPN
jgi:oligopeptidase B